jgi:adenylosuccinate lyase
MIDRYAKPEMAKLWTTEARFGALLTVEKAVAKAQSKLKIIPTKAWLEISKKAKFQVPKILEIEKITKHDIIAFVSNVAENVGDYGRFVHYGMTSSDVLDTATSVQIAGAKPLLFKAFDDLDTVFVKLIKKHSKTLCAGRTHGMHAEPTTFGYKLAGYYHEFLRNYNRIERAFEENAICKLSGAVGTYSFQDKKVEDLVAKDLKLKAEVIATQVIPRDRHAELLHAFALMATGFDRLAIELRHLQRTEVGEVVEGFTPGQKGSSAMPHKKNPISAENISGLHRMLKAYSQVADSNISLWHERDITHSSNERIILGDSFILLHYLTCRMKDLLQGLYVDKERMLKNMDLSQGNLFSSHVLLALIETGMSREDAYAKVQSLAHGLNAGQHLKDAVLKDKEMKDLLSKKQVQDIFSGKRHLLAIQSQLKKVVK